MTSGPRHRARGGLRARVGTAGLLPVAALALLVVLGLRTLSVARSPVEGGLAADGFASIATRSGLAAALFSPDGLGACTPVSTRP